MKIICIIPSRLASTRLPRKPLALIQGKPMIQRVYESAKECKLLTKVIVATDSEEIAEVIKAINGDYVMTPSEIPTGTDRVAYVAEDYPDANVVINLQGDEPFVTAKMLEALVSPYLAGMFPEMTTLACPLNMTDAYNNPSNVKVITDQLGNALYFSRSPIPFIRQANQHIPVYHHQGIYAFTRDFLINVYQKLPQTPLELTECIEQLRVLENGYKIKVLITPHKTLEINTPEELERAQSLI